MCAYFSKISKKIMLVVIFNKTFVLLFSESDVLLLYLRVMLYSVLLAGKPEKNTIYRKSLTNLSSTPAMGGIRTRSFSSNLLIFMYTEK
jgi:hypothetical protein